MAISKRERYIGIGVGAAIGLLALDRFALTPYAERRKELDLNIEQVRVKENAAASVLDAKIRMEKTCPVHGDVPKEEIVSGYEYAKGEYVIIEPEEIAKLRGERERARSRVLVGLPDRPARKAKDDRHRLPCQTVSCASSTPCG